jgi:ABC-type phosphate/phosphonate transport system ATPase subunit
LAMARQYTDRAIILEQGRVIFDGKSDNIEQEYSQLC